MTAKKHPDNQEIAPTFSIVTVVFNGKGHLRGTIESVRQQSWPYIEYIIVDGGSTDGTVAVIHEYAEVMPQMKWVSEPDRGLYDAMNKGLGLATGDFILFLNSGDHLHSPATIGAIASLANDDTDVIYGETMLVDDNRRPAGLMSELSTRTLPAKLNWRQYLGGMRVIHQSFIARRTIAPPYLEDNLCADYDWCIQILKKSRKIVNAGLVISDYLMGGVSKKRHRQSLQDRFQVMRMHFGLFPTLAAHAWILLRAITHRLSRTGKSRY
jgi:glycosyltransferase involved in cell wall biosynthesis